MCIKVEKNFLLKKQTRWVLPLVVGASSVAVRSRRTISCVRAHRLTRVGMASHREEALWQEWWKWLSQQSLGGWGRRCGRWTCWQSRCWHERNREELNCGWERGDCRYLNRTSSGRMSSGITQHVTTPLQRRTLIFHYSHTLGRGRSIVVEGDHLPHRWFVYSRHCFLLSRQNVIGRTWTVNSHWKELEGCGAESSRGSRSRRTGWEGVGGASGTRQLREELREREVSSGRGRGHWELLLNFFQINLRHEGVVCWWGRGTATEEKERKRTRVKVSCLYTHKCYRESMWECMCTCSPTV